MKWNDAFKLAEQYHSMHGNLLVPLNHVEDGYSLGRWIEWQRRRHSVTLKLNKSEGERDSEGIVNPGSEQHSGIIVNSEREHHSKSNVNPESERQSEIIVSPESKQDIGSKFLTESNQYSESNANQEREHHCESIVTSESKRRNKSSCSPLTEDQISRLDSIGMVWNLADYAWEQSFAVAEAYYKGHGNLAVPTDYCADGVNLNSWIRTQRRIRNGTLVNRKSPLTDEQIRRLDSIGMEWEPQDARWERCFAVAKKYYREHGNLNVPNSYEEDGVSLNRWLWTQRRIVNGEAGESAGMLTAEQIRRLDGIGMVWKPDSKDFSYYYDLCRQFYEEYGHTDFPEGDIVINGEILPESGNALTAWKKEQENADYPNGRGSLSGGKRALLHKIGIGTTKRACTWDERYRAAAEYYRRHGDLLVPFSYVTDDGINLGTWISKQRKRRKGKQGALLTDEQVRKLDAIGMSWDESGNRGKRKSQ